MGRPCKLTPDAHKRIVKAVRECATFKYAARAGGVDYDTFNTWMRKGKTGEEKKYIKFRGDVRDAEAAALLDLLNYVTRAAPGDWRAAMSMITKRFEGYAEKQALELSGTVKVDGFKELAETFREKVDTAAERLKNEGENDE